MHYNQINLPDDPSNYAAIFLHYGKTGGSSIGSAIDRQYSLNRLYVAHYNVHNDEFMQMPESVRTQIMCYRGITFYGIHDYIPRPTTYFGLIRHPVARVISQYFYNQRRHQREGRKIKREKTLEEMIDKADFQIQFRMQLAMTVGAPDMQTALTQPLPPDAVERAKQHYRKHFTVIAPTECFDEALLMMKHRFKWGSVHYGFRNRGVNKPRNLNIPAATLRRIEEKCTPEIELYEWVKDYFAEQLAAQPGTFHDDLARFKRRNKIYGFVWQKTDNLRKGKFWRTLRQTIAPTWQREHWQRERWQQEKKDEADEV